MRAEVMGNDAQMLQNAADAAHKSIKYDYNYDHYPRIYPSLSQSLLQKTAQLNQLACGIISYFSTLYKFARCAAFWFATSFCCAFVVREVVSGACKSGVVLSYVVKLPVRLCYKLTISRSNSEDLSSR